MSVIDNGGPAFPSHARADGSDGSWQVFELHAEGMSLRDYFAAHAPRKPQAWFSPDMPPKPERVYDHDHPNAPSCRYADECRIANWQERNAWDAARQQAVCVQWPYAWADAVLAQRKTVGAVREEMDQPVVSTRV